MFLLCLKYKTRFNAIEEVGRDDMNEEIKEKALELYQQNWKYKDIASELDISVNTFKSWIRRYGWTKNKGAPKEEKQEKVHPKKVGAPKGSRNALGNRGNRNASAPKGNKNAVTHGLHAKWLPSETNDIFNELLNSDPADILWNNIMIQYTAIIRAQRIMFVTDKEEMIKELKKEKESGGDKSWSEEKEWEFQFSWDRHASFLNAQSRAMATLGNLIKQFVAIADETDERRLKLELMQGQIDKLQGPQKNTSDTDWKEALKEAEEGKFGEIEDV